MEARKLKLSVWRVDHKCIDSDGEWDGTWDESFAFGIFDQEGYEVTGRDGYHTEEKARQAGEKALKRLGEENESKS